MRLWSYLTGWFNFLAGPAPRPPMTRRQFMDDVEAGVRAWAGMLQHGGSSSLGDPTPIYTITRPAPDLIAVSCVRVDGSTHERLITGDLMIEHLDDTGGFIRSQLIHLAGLKEASP